MSWMHSQKEEQEEEDEDQWQQESLISKKEWFEHVSGKWVDQAEFAENKIRETQQRIQKLHHPWMQANPAQDAASPWNLIHSIPYGTIPADEDNTLTSRQRSTLRIKIEVKRSVKTQKDEANQRTTKKQRMEARRALQQQPATPATLYTDLIISVNENNDMETDPGIPSHLHSWKIPYLFNKEENAVEGLRRSKK